MEYVREKARGKIRREVQPQKEKEDDGGRIEES